MGLENPLALALDGDGPIFLRQGEDNIEVAQFFIAQGAVVFILGTMRLMPPRERLVILLAWKCLFAPF